MQLLKRYLSTLPTKNKVKLPALNFLFSLAILWLGAFHPSNSYGYSNYVSTMVGGGYALGDSKGDDLQTFQNYGLIRLAFDLNLKYPFFWSIDLESFRIQRQEEVLDHHHYGEGGGFSIGARLQPYGFWLQMAQGRLRNLVMAVDNGEDRAQRYRYHSSAFGISYAIYSQEYTAIEIQTITKLITTERGWKQTYGYKNLQFVSFLLSLTLIDL